MGQRGAEPASPVLVAESAVSQLMAQAQARKVPRRSWPPAGRCSMGRSPRPDLYRDLITAAGEHVLRAALAGTVGKADWQTRRCRPPSRGGSAGPVTPTIPVTSASAGPAAMCRPCLQADAGSGGMSCCPDQCQVPVPGGSSLSAMTGQGGTDGQGHLDQAQATAVASG